MAITGQQAWAVLEQAECLYSQDQIETALTAMAAAITVVLKESNPLIVCVMNGGLVPLGRLLPQLKFPLQTDYIHASRYGEALTGGEIVWKGGPINSVADRTILLVDDILDEGVTLAAIDQRLRDAGAAVVLKAVLVTKRKRKPAATVADFSALEVPDRYVFGYGMDYEGYLRNLPEIYAVGGS